MSHNVFLGKGYYFSVSEINRDPILKNAVTGYGHHAQFDNKEVAWERIRKTEFPDLPTRVNAIFLFESEKDGKRAKSDWFNDEASPDNPRKKEPSDSVIGYNSGA